MTNMERFSENFSGFESDFIGFTNEPTKPQRTFAAMKKVNLNKLKVLSRFVKPKFPISKHKTACTS